MKIYFAGAIRGGREDAGLYHRIIEELNTYGEVLTEHIGDAALSVIGEDGPTDTYIHDRDMGWLLSADLLVAEVTVTSLGVGYEIGRAVENSIPVLCLFRAQEGKYLSAMISGNRNIVVKEYHSFEDLKDLFQIFFKNN